MYLGNMKCMGMVMLRYGEWLTSRDIENLWTGVIMDNNLGIDLERTLILIFLILRIDCTSLSGTMSANFEEEQHEEVIVYNI